VKKKEKGKGGSPHSFYQEENEHRIFFFTWDQFGIEGTKGGKKREFIKNRREEKVSLGEGHGEKGEGEKKKRKASIISGERKGKLTCRNAKKRREKKGEEHNLFI